MITHILDIGYGTAFTIDIIHNHFNEISLVEPNIFFRKQWHSKSWFNDNKHTLHIHPITIQQLIKSNQIQKKQC